MNNRILITLYVISLLSVSSLSLAGWSGPKEVVTGTWGRGPGQFYYHHGESTDSFPDYFGVDKHGIIVIPDETNKRITIYNANGTVKKVLSKPVDLPDLDSSGSWPPSGFHLFQGGNSFTVNCNYQKMGGGRGPLNICFLNYDGSVVAKIDIKGVNDETTPISNGYIVIKKPQYFLYSPTGQLVQTYASKPLELGIFDEFAGQPDGSNKVIVRYPERTFSITVPDQRPEEISRDSAGYLYATQRFIDELNANTPEKQTIQHYRVIRYDFCNKEIGRLDLPKDVEKVIGHDNTNGNLYKIIAGYGQPVIAPNGDLYVWKRTPNKYIILKWTWVDDPAKRNRSCLDQEQKKQK